MTTATLQKLEKGIKFLVVQTVQEVLTDPDFGLALRWNVKRRLRVARRSTKTVPFSAIKQKYA